MSTSFVPSRRDLANAVRALAMDAVQQAGNGHPGAPMGMADVAEVLWNDVLRHNPGNPQWPDRDRFVLSNGHGSMLLYALLHLSGYGVSREDLRQFRQLHSRTPGHPEFGETPGVETTTGPLGQGFANAVGMALAEKLLEARFNRDGHAVVDHRTFVFVGDGCLMEGISHEAASLAGTLRLGKLVCLYDDNGISIDGDVRGWFTEDTRARFAAYGWRVIDGVDGHSSEAVAAALREAVRSDGRPTLVCCRTTIGFGAPNKAGTADAHGAALGEAEVALAREQLNWPYPPFEVPPEIGSAWDAREAGAAAEADWQGRFDAYAQAYPDLAAEFSRCMAGQLPAGFAESMQALLAEVQAAQRKLATRKASNGVIGVLAAQLPELVGGSADLTGSNGTRHGAARMIGGESAAGDYISWGVREFGMTAITNGMLLHGGVRPFSGTFLVFMDYARNAVRMAALMGIPNIFVYTHDSISVGEDGPTHQPVEHLVSLRSTPNVQTWRPADEVECVVAWQAAIERADGPTALVLSRQDLPPLARDEGQLALLGRGGYVLRESVGPLQTVLIATGSEVALAEAAWQAVEGRGVRVVSMPCLEVFAGQDEAWREAVLPAAVRRRVAIEAGHPAIWYRWVGDGGRVIGIEEFGRSAPGGELMAEYGFSVEHVLQVMQSLDG